MATRVSERSLRRIVNEVLRCVEDGTVFRTASKHHSVPKQITNPDDFDTSVIQRTVYDFYTQEAVPTLRKLLPKLRESINFKRGSTNLKLILQAVGFKCKNAK
jgi:hypothetical protein